MADKPAVTQPISSKTGSATIKKTGHTAGKNFGTNPDAKVRGGNQSRDLSI